ncbi:restriction endonuclease subunit S [Phocaeicola massiliensis]|uniref:restriction endonuclease subunit S n=1 Tax=Phocaeicola massiliensis TaxID=204516 RepID=UPI001E633E09|nr:hypothetical protein [Phocaeicola massiliensis]
MKKYNAYKDSGVKWIGEIPSHWGCIKIKHLLKERVEKSADGIGEPLSMSQKFGLIPTSQMDIVPNAATSYIGAKHTHRGDMVLNKLKAHLGVFALSSYDGLVSPDYAVYYGTGRADMEFLEYLFKTPLYVSEFIKKTTGVAIGFNRLYTDDLFSISAHYPPLHEQQAIVDYLKDKTLKIEQYVFARERERELLDSLKQSEIANVVTKGLNPNVKMKDSGIPWIGEIPEHWEVKKMRSIFRLAHEKTEKERTDLLSLSQYTGIRYKSQCDKTGMFEAESTVGYNIVHKGQFVMNIMLAWNGSYAVSDLEGIISPSYCIFDFKEDCDKRYFNYLLRTEMYQGEFKANSKGLIDSRLRLYPDYFFPIGVIVPPIEEQKAISDYIDSKLQKIDQYMSDLQREIDYLKEFKQRLISDAVTGQLCVTKQ